MKHIATRQRSTKTASDFGVRWLTTSNFLKMLLLMPLLLLGNVVGQSLTPTQPQVDVLARVLGPTAGFALELTDDVGRVVLAYLQEGTWHSTLELDIADEADATTLRVTSGALYMVPPNCPERATLTLFVGAEHTGGLPATVKLSCVEAEGLIGAELLEGYPVQTQELPRGCWHPLFELAVATSQAEHRLAGPPNDSFILHILIISNDRMGMTYPDPPSYPSRTALREALQQGCGAS